MKCTNAPSGEYVVIDRGAAPAANSVSYDGAQISHDTIGTGATSQGSNPFKNGSIPDYIATGATTVRVREGSSVNSLRNSDYSG